ncbi:MAG: hypothetical protein RL021_139 [Bacteroidota bacterium]|jgi:hypothetical protein
MKRLNCIRLLLLLFALPSAGQDTLHVLFIGNSYTYVNNLPQLTADLSWNTGKVLLFDSSTPGGYSYDLHSNDANTLAKIRQGGWDAVVLQEQSQIPTIDYYRYNSMYPAAERLRDSIRTYSPCARIITFMTWGRRFGGQQCANGYCSPPFADFNAMQDSLMSAYLEVSENIGAACAPVGIAWRKALEDTAVVLHATDNSHPALNGSYLAACVFYSMLWDTSPLPITYSAGIDPVLAGRFRQIADSTVFYGVSDWNRDADALSAQFQYTSSADTFCFVPMVSLPPGTAFHWDFGDGTTDANEAPCHVFSQSGNYPVSLMVERCGQSDSSMTVVPVTFSSTNVGPLVDERFQVMRMSQGLFLIRYKVSPEADRFRVFDLQGKCLVDERFNQKEALVDLHAQADGVYLFVSGNDRIRIVK